MREPPAVVRAAAAEDADAVLSLYDEAVAWLAARGRADQWGTAPFSARPDIAALIRARAGRGKMWIACAGTQILGAIVLDRQPPPYIDWPASGPEIYLSGFITSRHPSAGLLRLDCYAGGDGALVAYYESVGFRQVARFTKELLGSVYTGCLLEQQLTEHSR